MSEKIKISIRDGKKNAQYGLLHEPKKTLLETMREGAVLLPSLCGGTGKCGRCMVRFCGYAPLPTPTDRSVIAPDKLREGYRLACMARPKRDCIVEMYFEEVKAAEEGKLHAVTDFYAASGEERKKGDIGVERMEGGGGGGRTFVAADIGTTTIAMQLVDGCSGSIRDTYTCLNPQRSYGTDVISRIKAAGEGHGERLKELVRNALATGLGQLKESANRQGVKEPELLCIACNTAMGHIFMGYPVETLGKSPFLPADISMGTARWEGMDVVVMPGASAFIGGDIVAGLYACGLSCSGMLEKKAENAARKTAEKKEREENAESGKKDSKAVLEGSTRKEVKESREELESNIREEGKNKEELESGIGEEGKGNRPCSRGDGKTDSRTERKCGMRARQEDGAWLFMDLGTNAEMVMGNGRHMAATAAAAGPAFEGRGVDGVNGPERIYAIAHLLERGVIDATGLLEEPYFEKGADVETINRAGNGTETGSQAGNGIETINQPCLRAKAAGKPEKGKIHVTQEDIRAVQMAKAAVRAGIHFLMEKLGIKDLGRIKKVYIAGGMGFYLDRKAAARIGLLPAELAQKAETVGNTALAGACLLGRKNWQEWGRELEHVAGDIEVFQMAELADFSDIYIGYMDFDCNISSNMI